MFIARAMCGLTYVTVAALCSCCSLQKYFGNHRLLVTKGPTLTRVRTQYLSLVTELYTVYAQ